MRLGFDVSNFSGDPEYHAVRALVSSMDLEHIIIACQFEATFGPWYDVARQLGLRIDAYQFIYAGRGEAEQMQAALETIGKRYGPVERLWFDYEEQSPNVSPSTELAVMTVPAAQPCGIYTRTDWWLGHGNVQLGRSLPLWNASYTLDDTAIVPVDFGGWQRAHVQQYNGGYQSYGLNVGLDLFRS